MQAWFVWLISGVVIAILELLTPGFVIGCFSIGCFAAAIVAALDFNFTVQVSVFSATTFLIFVAARPLLVKLVLQKKKLVQTNVDRLVGMVGLALEDITDLQGSVKVEGEIWSSRTSNGEALPAGAQVRIVRVEGNKLIVAPHSNRAL